MRGTTVDVLQHQRRLAFGLLARAALPSVKLLLCFKLLSVAVHTQGTQHSTGDQQERCYVGLIFPLSSIHNVSVQQGMPTLTPSTW